MAQFLNHRLSAVEIDEVNINNSLSQGIQYTNIRKITELKISIHATSMSFST